MITIKELSGQTFESKELAIKELIANKEIIKAQKKAVIKHSDSVFYTPQKTENKAVKNNGDTIKAQSVINTTNFLDSHGDVHIKGIWNKSVKERKNLLLIQEHQMTFDKIISDDVDAELKEFSFKDLGFDYSGTTEALIFNSTIDKQRNEFMFNQYSKGYVKEHSVGMQYVKLDLAVSPELAESKEENDVWEKYIDEVANKSEAESMGYFWAVTEAKVIEGSAVVKGSNSITPTLNIEAVNDTSKNEPSNDTQKIELFYNKLLKN